MPRPVRIPGQTPDEWNDETSAEFDAVVTMGRQRPVHLPSVIAHHPTFLSPYLGWAKAIALHGVLTPRQNSMLALRSIAHAESEFEWGVHVETALHRSGMTEEEVRAVAVGPDDPSWSREDALLLQAADDLHGHHAVTDATWTGLAEYHDTAALLEICFIVGHYAMLSMVANSAGVPPEPTWAPLGEAG